MKAPQTDNLNPLALSGVDLANILSRTPYTKVTPAAIVRWVSLGCPRNSDRTYSLVNVAAWLHSKYAERPRKASAESNEEKHESIMLKRERTRKLRIENKLLQGRYVDREEVKAEIMGKLYAIKHGLEALDRSLGRDLLGLPTAQAIEAKIRERTRDLLYGFASGWEPTEADAEAGEIPKHADAAQSSGGVAGAQIGSVEEEADRV